ncbi:MAG: CotH kinase family protein, partial [Planctomycetota bacterium]|nr:CotH kinase family protein [Planctomycetota bacterium]
MRNFVAASFLCFVLVPAALAQVPDLYDMDTVRDIKLTFQQSNWWTQLRNNKSSRAEIKADMVVDNVTYKDVGVRFRGNTSYSYNVGRSEKLPFNIRTDAFVSGQKLYGYDNLNLINAHRDATFIREPVSYLMMRRHFPAMKSNWVKLWLNNVYWGIYVNTEQPGKDFARDSFDDEDGNLYRGDSPSRLTRPTLTYLGSNIASYQGQYDYYTNNHPLPWVDLVNLCFVLDRTPMAQLPARLPQVLNVDRALWYLAVQNILSNTDSYIGVGNDYLAYHDETHGRFSILPWDLNTTFGAYDLIRKPLDPQWLKRMDPFSDGGEPWLSLRRPLMTRLWGVPQWRERYLAHFRAMLDDWFDWSVVGPILTKYHKMLDP